MTTQEAIDFLDHPSTVKILDRCDQDGLEYHLMLISREQLGTKTHQEFESSWDTVPFRDVVLTGIREIDLQRLAGCDDAGFADYMIPPSPTSIKNYGRRVQAGLRALRLDGVNSRSKI